MPDPTNQRLKADQLGIPSESADCWFCQDFQFGSQVDTVSESTIFSVNIG